MPLIEYKCQVCGKSTEEIVKFPIPTEITCEEEGCDGLAVKQMSVAGGYKMTGNNSASVTPKKFRG